MAVTLEITPTHMALKGGEFDTRYKYMALDNVSPSLYMVSGPTISSQSPVNSSVTWTFKAGGLTVKHLLGGNNAASTAAPISNVITGVDA